MSQLRSAASLIINNVSSCGTVSMFSSRNRSTWAGIRFQNPSRGQQAFQPGAYIPRTRQSPLTGNARADSDRKPIEAFHRRKSVEIGGVVPNEDRRAAVKGSSCMKASIAVDLSCSTGLSQRHDPHRATRKPAAQRTPGARDANEGSPRDSALDDSAPRTHNPCLQQNAMQ